MDADFSHDPRHLPAMVECMQRADVAIGSRYVPGGGDRRLGRQPALHEPGNQLVRAAVAGAFDARQQRRLIAAIGWRSSPRSNSIACGARGYAFQEEILYRCRRVGCRFEETPIVFRDRRYGTSKINWRESADGPVDHFSLGARESRRRPA